MNSLKRTARITAALILVTTVFAPAILFASTLIVPGDAAATTANLQVSTGAFRLSMAGQAVIFLSEVLLVAVLYDLLAPVNKTLASSASVARAAMAVLQGINLLTLFFALQLAGGAGYLAGFDPAQLQALVLLSLQAYEFVVLLWGLFFGLQLVLLGYLVYRSGYMPKWLGILLLLTSVGYLVPSFGSILVPGFDQQFAWLTAFAYLELVFPLWLLIKGVREQPALAAAAA